MATDPRRSAPWLATVALAVTLGAVLVVGHQEAAVYACVFLGAYLVARLIALPSRLAVAARLGAGVALGTGLTAVQSLPYVEYFRHSAANAHRASMTHQFLDARFVALHVFPKLLGAPTGYQDRSLHVVTYLNFNTIVSFYIGTLVLVIAGAGAVAFTIKPRFVPGFFAGVALVWTLYGYNVAGVGTVISKLPVARFAIADRGNFVWLFSLSVLAAFGLDALTETNGALRSQRRASWPTLAGVGAGSLALFLAAWIAAVALRHALTRAPFSPPDHHPLSGANARHVVLMFLVGLAAIGILIASRRRRARLFAGAALLAMVFAQTGFMLRDFNPTVAADTFYPTTSAMQTIRSTVGTAQTMTQGNASMYPSVNLWYRVHSPETYDTLGVREYDDLYTQLLRVPQAEPGSPIQYTAGFGTPRSLSALQGVGIAYIATNLEYPSAKSVVSVAARATPSDVLVPDRPVTQSITMHDDGLNTLLTSGPRGPLGQTCHLRIADAKTGIELRRASAPCGAGLAAFSFNPFRGAVGRSVSVSVWSGQRVTPAAPGRFVIDGIATELPGLQPVARNGWLHILRVPGVERYSAPARAVAARDAKAATRLLLGRGFDPIDTVAVAADAGPSDREAGHVTVVSEGPTTARLDVKRSGAGWVLARISKFPGWHATVNGHAAHIVAADAAFMAVRVPAGSSTVTFAYRPASVTIGLIVSSVSAAALLTIALAAALGPRRSRHSRQRPAA